MGELLDYTNDLRRLASMALDPSAINDTIGEALVSLQSLVPYDLAAIFQLQGQRLVVRAARGPLNDDRIAAHTLELSRFPTIRRAMDTRRPVALLDHDHASDEGDPYDGVLDLPHGHSCMVVPLFAGDRSLGVITLDRGVCEAYPQPLVDLAGVYGQIVSLALVFAEQASLLDRYREQLSEQNRLLTEEHGHGHEACDRLVEYRTPAMRRLVLQAKQVAPTDVPVLIQGETGAGKEVLAEALHQWGTRCGQAFVKLNCAAIPESLIESELFGHVKGAFSGATGSRPGRFLTANGGTLLLDEIGDMPPAAQSKLLRVLQEGTFEPVGSDKTVKVDVRVIAATHRDLEEAVRDGRFREDLYYRLAVFPLYLPPLRERAEDIPALAASILEGIQRRTGRGPWRLTPGAERALQARVWPGNVRELVNSLERATILSPDGAIGPDLVAELGRPTSAGGGVGGSTRSAGPGFSVSRAAQRALTLDEVQRQYITTVLRHCGGRIYGPDGAAALLGMKPTTLQSRMKKLGVDRRPSAQ